jgi:hypothetical protein
MRVELREEPINSINGTSQSATVFTLFGYTVGDEPVRFLSQDVQIEIVLPANVAVEDSRPMLYVWDLFSLAIPRWRQLPTQWDLATRTLHTTTSQLGTFAVTADLHNTLFLPLIST